MQGRNLTTITMVKVAQVSEDRAEQIALLEELRSRRDLYNLDRFWNWLWMKRSITQCVGWRPSAPRSITVSSRWSG
jgi:hypothetical protein